MTGLPPNEIADRLAISDALDTYAAGVDARDRSLTASVFAPDAVLDYSGAGVAKGTRDEVLDTIFGLLERIAVTQHMLTNKRIRVSGDEARSEASLFNPVGVTGPSGEMVLSFIGGSYDDRWRRTPEGWRIVERTAAVTWVHGPAARAFEAK